ncbi:MULTISPECIES: SpaN/EivJ family type III secretion system needle length determinant [unclassified Pseudomonas]|uniref:SpaN/EivJ family type III secretion system needle length determinant n=1 Tax=unclassified Pseudomonas TaxID=196821 RepID=UPI0030D6D63C
MNPVHAVSPRPVQALEPVDEGSLDQWLDPLVPVQEDELPQGVLQLMASLILPPQRPMSEAARALARQALSVGQGVLAVEGDEARSVVQETLAVESDGKRLAARETVAFPPLHPQLGKLAQHSLPQRLEPVVSGIDKTMGPTPVEPPEVEPFTAPRLDEQPLPQAPLSVQGARQMPAVAPAALPSPVLPPVLEVTVETLPDTGRGVLQVPFNKGAASGQITITRGAEEFTRSLTLNPSNALVFEQLKAPFELAREPAWQLSDSGGEQPRQDSHQAPDEEPDEQTERPA